MDASGTLVSLVEDAESVQLEPGKAAIIGQGSDSGVQILIVSTRGTSSPASPGLSVVPEASSPGAAVLQFQSVASINTPLGGTGLLLMTASQADSKGLPFVWMGDEQAAPSPVDVGQGAGSMIFPRYLTSPAGSVQVGEDVAAVYAGRVPASSGTSLTLVQSLYPYGQNGTRQQLTSFNETHDSSPMFFRGPTEKQCALLRVGINGNGITGGCFDSMGELILAQDMPQHPLEVSRNLSADAFDPASIAPDELGRVLNYDGETVGIYFWQETTSMGKEMYYWDLEHRPFMLADMVAGSAGPVTAITSDAALVGGQYLCFAADLTQASGQEPAVYDLSNGTFTPLNVATSNGENSQPKYIAAISPHLCLMSVETSNWMQTDIGREFFTLNVSDIAAGLALADDFVSGSGSGDEALVQASYRYMGHGWYLSPGQPG